MKELVESVLQTLYEDFVYLTSIRGENNLWARLLNACEKRPNTVPTACVGIAENGHTWFGWNEEWLSKLEAVTRRIVYIHEAGHLFLRHIPRAFLFAKNLTDPEDLAKFGAIRNLAQDAAVNDAICRNERGWQQANENLEEVLGKGAGLILPETYNLPRDKHFEFYARWMMNNIDKVVKITEGISGETFESYKDMEEWSKKVHRHIPMEDMLKDKTSEELEQIINKEKRKTRELVKNAWKGGVGHGVLGGRLQGQLDDILQATPPVPWLSMLDDVVKTRLSHKEFQEGIFMPNPELLHSREFFPYPGPIFQNGMTIGFATDTSGSMDDREVLKAARYMVSLKKAMNNLILWGIHADYGIQAEFLIEEDDDVENMLGKCDRRYGYGGTSLFQPVNRFLHQSTGWGDKPVFEQNCVGMLTSPPESVDFIIYATDGYVPDCPVNTPVPILWLITPGGHVLPGMENVIIMEDSE